MITWYVEVASDMFPKQGLEELLHAVPNLKTIASAPRSLQHLLLVPLPNA